MSGEKRNGVKARAREAGRGESKGEKGATWRLGVGVARWAHLCGIIRVREHERVLLQVEILQKLELLEHVLDCAAGR